MLVRRLNLTRTPFGTYFRATWTSPFNVTGLDPVRFVGGTRALSSSIYNLYARTTASDTASDTAKDTTRDAGVGAGAGAGAGAGTGAGVGARDPTSNGQNNDEAGFPLHRLQSDEAWNYYAGDGDIVLYEFDLASGAVRTIHVGVGGASSVPQYTVPGLTWVGALLDTGASWALTGSANTPAFDARDSEMAADNATFVEDLYRRFPTHHDLLRRLLGF